MFQQEYVSFQDFQKEYFDKLKTPSCLPSCIEELCGGCKINMAIIANL